MRRTGSPLSPWPVVGPPGEQPSAGSWWIWVLFSRRQASLPVTCGPIEWNDEPLSLGLISRKLKAAQVSIIGAGRSIPHASAFPDPDRSSRHSRYAFK